MMQGSRSENLLSRGFTVSAYKKVHQQKAAAKELLLLLFFTKYKLKNYPFIY